MKRIERLGARGSDRYARASARRDATPEALSMAPW
jgi:hypothetical protein